MKTEKHFIVIWEGRDLDYKGIVTVTTDWTFLVNQGGWDVDSDAVRRAGFRKVSRLGSEGLYEVVIRLNERELRKLLERVNVATGRGYTSISVCRRQTVPVRVVNLSGGDV